jgi:hypothetical protein
MRNESVQGKSVAAKIPIGDAGLRTNNVMNRCMLAVLLAVGLGLTAAAQDKDSFTPMALDAGFGPMDISTPAIAPEEIIRQFAAKESEFQKALDHYTYRRVVRVQTIDDDNKVDGEYYQVDDVIFDSTGKRMEKVVYAPSSSLERIMMSPTDFHDILYGFPFVLTTGEVGQYNLKYIGKQKVDEVDCYVFEVNPKTIEKNKRYLSGKVWVDATDLQIVVVDGRMIPDDTRKGNEDLHAPFMTWRQQVDGKFWFPVYTKGEGILHFSGGHGYMAQDVHVRNIVKYTDYKQFGSTIRILDDVQEVPSPSKAPAAKQPK